MFLKTAIVLCKEPKTDAELKAIMATHPWAPALIHGFRRVRCVTWEDEYYHVSLYSLPDSIYIDVGYGLASRHEKWLAESFHKPFCSLKDRSIEEHLELEENWWRASAALLLRGIPENYHSHVVYYGEIEDEFEPGQAEEAWKYAILANCDFDPKVVAEFESTAA